jgi:hypothetical protein
MSYLLTCQPNPSGVSDEEIQESIIQTLKDDGWKDDASTPMINEIAGRTKGVAEIKGSPRSSPKTLQDTTAVMMAQLRNSYPNDCWTKRARPTADFNA